MHPQRPRRRGGRVPRWGANPPPPPPLPSPPPSPPSSQSPPPEEHDGGNEPGLRRLLSRFTRTMSTALHGRRNTEGSDIKRVKELGAKEFHGGADPGEADAWLTDVERIFEVLQCLDGDKTVRRGYANPAAITWEEFQRAFFDQFYPHTYKNAKKSEFLHLRQGSMSVFEYEHKFNELSRFVPELVTTKEDKCTRFEEGLWLDIQAVVTATTYPTIRALAQAADRVAKKYSLGAGIGRRRRDSSGFGGPVRVHQRGVDLALVLPVVVGQEDVGPVPVDGSLALDHPGVSPRDNNQWVVQPGILRGSTCEEGLPKSWAG
ncbi:unnamed protein product [Prunus brigantina]